MKREDAARFVAALVAAFPTTRVGDDTVAIYVEMVSSLRSEAAMEETVRLLHLGAIRFPTIAEIVQTYRRVYPQFAPRAIPEPEISEEEWRANLDRLRALKLSVDSAIEERTARVLGESEAEEKK